MDQQMQSINALWFFCSHFVQLVLLTPDSLTVALPASAANSTFCVRRSPIQSNTCGIIPMEKVQHVSTAGLRWECDGPMQMGGLVSSSNEMEGDHVMIRTTGDLLWTASTQLKPQTGTNTTT